MKQGLKVLFSGILIAMLVVTTWASFHESVFAGGAKILAEPWGVATLFDTYFGFLTFYIWLAYRETGIFKRIVWFVAVMALGNIAMSFYVLRELWLLPEQAPLSDLLLAKKETGL